MKYTGIIINSNTYKDNDLIVDLLTENDGIITFRSKGIKKTQAKNRSLIIDFAYIEAEFFKKGDKITLINGQNLLNLGILYSSFEGLVFINFIKEILFKLVVDEDKPLLYGDLKKSLFVIEKTPQNNVILQYLINNLLKIGKIAGFDPLAYFEGSNFCEVINEFLEIDNETNNYDTNQLLLIIKKLSYYLEETSDIKIESLSLLEHL